MADDDALAPLGTYPPGSKRYVLARLRAAGIPAMVHSDGRVWVRLDQLDDARDVLADPPVGPYRPEAERPWRTIVDPELRAIYRKHARAEAFVPTIRKLIVAACAVLILAMVVSMVVAALT